MMKSITEEKRQELIGLCRIEVRRWKHAAEAVPDKIYMVELMEIALACLDAAPDHYIFKHPAGDLLDALVSKDCKGHEDVVPGYLVPPVPVMQPVIAPDLPEDCDRTEAHYKYAAAIRAAGYEVK